MTEEELVGWHHGLNGHEFEQAPRVGDGQGGLACCSPWGHKELDTTERLNCTEKGKLMQSRQVALLRSALETYFLLLLIDLSTWGNLILDSVISTFYQPSTLLLQCYRRELTKISNRPPGSPAAQALTEHAPGDQGVSICINPGSECKPLSVMGAGRMAQGAVAFLLMLMA